MRSTEIGFEVFEMKIRLMPLVMLNLKILPGSHKRNHQQPQGTPASPVATSPIRLTRLWSAFTYNFAFFVVFDLLKKPFTSFIHFSDNLTISSLLSSR